MTRRQSFNGAGAFQRRKPDADLQHLRDPDASMEPAPFSAGNILVRHTPRRLSSASMEPAPFSAGNAPETLRDALNDVASMEPAPFSAGNLAFRAIRPSMSSRLQWSRRLSAPETRASADNNNNGVELQWSRRLSAPETPGTSSSTPSPDAASMEPAPFSAGNHDVG